jgi:hypothetical protein
MNNKDFTAAINELEETANSILKVKGDEYTLGKGEQDRHTNFKEVANLLGLQPKQVWAVYWMKHVFSILSWVKGGSFGSEPAINRFADERNYSYLGYGLYLEEQLENELRQMPATAAQYVKEANDLYPLDWKEQEEPIHSFPVVRQAIKSAVPAPEKAQERHGKDFLIDKLDDFESRQDTLGHETRKHGAVTNDRIRAERERLDKQAKKLRQG